MFFFYAKNVLPCMFQIFFYSTGIYKNAGVQEDAIPYAVIGTNLVNVIMTIITVSHENSLVILISDREIYGHYSGVASL